MAETKIFPRVDRPSTSDCRRRVASVLGTQRFTYHYGGVAAEIRIDDWTGVDLVAVQLAITNADTPGAQRRTREKSTYRDRRQRAIIAWMAQKHGMTLQDALAEIDTIHDGMS